MSKNKYTKFEVYAFILKKEKLKKGYKNNIEREYVFK